MLVFDDVEDRVKFLCSEQAEFDGFLFHVSGLLIIRFPPGTADRAAIDPFQFEEGLASRRTESAGSLDLPLGNDEVLQFSGFLPVVGLQSLVQGNSQPGEADLFPQRSDNRFEYPIATRLLAIKKRMTLPAQRIFSGACHSISF